MLSRVDCERITDSVLKLQSVRAQLDNLTGAVSRIEEIKECLDHADANLRDALKHQKNLLEPGSR